MSGISLRFERIADLKKPLLILALIGIAIRLILAPTLTFNIDMGYWAEVVEVFRNGFGLYGTAGYYYTPIWGYCLGFVSFMMQLLGMTDYGMYVPEMAHLVNEDFKISSFVTSVVFNTMVKIPLILVDFATAYLLYRFVKKYTNDEKKSLLAFSLWMFSPLIITQSSVHGMFDNISALLMLITIMFLFERKYFIAGFAYSLALLTKFFPLFFIFFLVAVVLKKEGMGTDGIKKLLTAIIGVIVGAAVVYIPNIIRGDIWLSIFFITSRIGLTKKTLESIGPIETVLILSAFAIFITTFLLVVYYFGPKIVKKLEMQDENERNRRIAKKLLAISLILIALTGLYILYDTLKHPNGLESLGLKCVILFYIFSIFLEIYLAYRIIMEKELDDKKMMTFLFLTALSVILWPSAPSYILVVLPFVIIYCTMVDGRYVKPFIILSTMVTIQEITAFMTSPTSLLLLLNGNVDVMIPIYEFLAFPVIGNLTGSVLLGFVAITGWLSIIYLSYKWYSEYYHRGEV